MKPHTKKIIAPVIITILFVLYFIGFAVTCIVFTWIPFLVKLIAGVIPLLLAGVCIYVLLERIKEIRSGEEDDLSQY